MGTRIRATPVHLRAILPVRDPDRGTWRTACGRWAPAEQVTNLATGTTCPDCQESGAYRAQW